MTKAATGRDFSGHLTRYVIAYLEEHTPAGTVEAVLALAGETRSAAALSDTTIWSSYVQYRRLLEATAEVLGGSATLRTVGSHILDSVRSPQMAETMLALGSPVAVMATLCGSNDSFAPAIEMTMEEIGPKEIQLVFGLKVPHEPFPELCAYEFAMMAALPALFGYRAEVLDEVCQCDGAPHCSARISWASSDDDDARVGRAEMQTRSSEARLDELQATVAELVSGDGVEPVLTRVVAAAARAVQALWFVLDIRAGGTFDRFVHTHGTDQDDAVRMTQMVRDAATPLPANVLVSEVASERSHYGHLVAVRSDLAGFEPRERSVLDSYARLAASALDTDAAISEARRQARAAQALLGLSSSLADLSSSEEMLARLTRAAPLVIDCDQVIVADTAPDGRTSRVHATHGVDADTEFLLRSLEIPIEEAPTDPPVLYRHPELPSPSAFEAALVAAGALRFCTLAIVSGSEMLGWITVTVTSHPERLDDDAAITNGLRGLAGQAAIAFRNARLLVQLVDTARQAGMAEIATNVLHNVGNVLNSVNVSANVVAQRVRGSKSAGLSKAARLIGEHAGDLGQFLTTDPRGQALPGYLVKLAEALSEERDSIEIELRRLSEGIAHIAEIVNAQQSLTGIDGVIEPVNLIDAIEDAVRMAGVENQPALTVIRDVADVGLISLDRHRLLLILVNLITNAAYATSDNIGRPRQVTVRVETAGPAAVTLRVTDNGGGIAAENLTRIFGHGFTTHRGGHGFGLHSSSLAAIEMGGALSVHSDGIDCGAEFVLELSTPPQLVAA